MADLFGKAEPENPHYVGHRKRLRERFLNEPKVLPDYELLEMLLFVSSSRTDVKPLAKKLLAKFGSLAKVLTAENIELEKVEGMNVAAIASIKSVREAGSRFTVCRSQGQAGFEFVDQAAGLLPR